MCCQTVISVDKTESRASVAVIAHEIVQNYNATFTLMLTNNTKKHVMQHRVSEANVQKWRQNEEIINAKAPKKFHWTETWLSPGNRTVNC
jgi:hypothetical protein